MTEMGGGFLLFMKKASYEEGRLMKGDSL